MAVNAAGNDWERGTAPSGIPCCAPMCAARHRCCGAVEAVRVECNNTLCENALCDACCGRFQARRCRLNDEIHVENAWSEALEVEV